MKILDIRNPFPCGRSYVAERVGSTQDEAKLLAESWDRSGAEPAFPCGSLIAAEEQLSGRGRVRGRQWRSVPGADLLFTLRLSSDVAALPALPLRIGSALCRAVSGLAASAGRAFNVHPRIKWPNDLMLGDRKAAGVLCEAGGQGVLAGIGVNCARRDFPPEIRDKATSLEAELGRPVDRWALLELILGEIRSALGDDEWRRSLTPLLWRRGEEVTFAPGPAAESGVRIEPIRARLVGVDQAGALVLALEDGRVEAFLSGELTADYATR